MKRYLLNAALCCSLATTAMANQATLINASPDHHSLKVEYRVAFKNPQGQTVFGPVQTIQLGAQEIQIPFKMNGYQLAGIVPVAIEGHQLPDNVNAFDQPRQCSLTTDEKHDSGTLKIIYHEMQGHKQLICGVQGGIFG